MAKYKLKYRCERGCGADVLRAANAITGGRIICSLALLPTTAFSFPFYTLYILAGLSDAIDGTVARKTGTAGEFGEKFDTVADFIFVAACLIKLLPLIEAPIWMYLWVAGVAFIKIANVFINYVRLKKLVSVHSVINKIAGAALFAFPLCFNLIDTTLFAAALCVVATAASLHESRSVLRKGS